MRSAKEKLILVQIGSILLKRRMELKLPRTKLALILGVDEKQIRRIENGEVNPTILTLYKMCIALDFDINFLSDINIEENFLDY